MRAVAAMLVVLIAAVFFGCSMPERVTIVNRSNADLALEFKDGKKRVITAGQSAELSFASFFLASAVTHGGVRKQYVWRLPPDRLMDQRQYPRKVSLCLEPDGKIHAADATLSDGGRQPVQPQPAGFPLDGTP